MDSAVKTRRSTQESFELQQLEFNAQMAGILDEGMLRDSCSLQQDRDLIFEEGEEEGGDHSVGPDFECNGIEVIWLANNELNNASADRESEVFYPTVHVGANETATVIGTSWSITILSRETFSARKICRTGSPTSPDDLNNNGVDPNQQSPILPQTSLDGQHRPEPSQIETRFEEKQVHATTSEAFTVFSEANIKEQQHTRSSNLWMSKLQEADVSVSSATTFSADQLDHPNTYMEDSQSFNAQFSGECSPLVGNGKSEPERKLVGGYVLPQNNFQLSMSNFHQNGAIASNSNHLLPQQQNYGFTNSANTYLTYAIMPNNQISQNVLPVYMNDGLSYNQAFNISNNCDVNANVFSYNMGQHRQSEQNVTQLEISSSLGSPSTFEANREGIAENSCHDFVPLHQTMCTYSSSIGTLPTSSFFNQLSTDSSCQHYTSSITTNKVSHLLLVC
ncbi:hypothetical protein DICVIV_06958 [Dictyocaulus viviparus]|uniref:Uncharacterized protein n=1 Tax=Dictyocaulus viviparus TaxID=29172 RepID=A0A0D8XT37_DICVI|nr:hypothetical protein DICVIV_06958 [Dictyocaulus viviparus]